MKNLFIMMSAFKEHTIETGPVIFHVEEKACGNFSCYILADLSHVHPFCLVMQYDPV